MDSTATIGVTTRGNIPKKSRYETTPIAIGLSYYKQQKDWIIASTYRNTSAMSAYVLTKVMPLEKLFYLHPRAYGKI